MNTWQYGNSIRLTGTFRDYDSNLIDPSEVKVSVLKPNGGFSTYVYGVNPEVERSSIGVYTIEVLGDIVGIWYYRWFTDTPDEVSKEVLFEIIRVRAI